jgi:cytochrome P450/thioesterase domain-containing protein/acyl carrier protein
VATENLASAPETNLATRLNRLGSAERRHVLIEHIANEISRLAKAEKPTPLPETRLTETGLDSLGGMQLIGHIERQFGVAIPITTLLGSATLDDLVAKVEQLFGANAAEEGSQNVTAHPLQSRRSRALALRDWEIAAPLFLIPGTNGTAYYLSSLCKAFDTDRACIAFQAPGIDGAEAPLGSIEEMARRYAEEMRTIQPHGPYAIAGHSSGGVVAYEIAQLLAEQGETVSPLILMDAPISEAEQGTDQSDEVMALFELISVYCRFSEPPMEPPSAQKLTRLPREQQRQALWALLSSNPAAAHVVNVYRKSFAALVRYRPRHYAGPVVLLRSKEGLPVEAMYPERRARHQFASPTLGWDRFCPVLQVIDVPGDHFTMVMPPNASALASTLQRVLNTHVTMKTGLDRLRPASHARTIGRALMVDPDGIHFDPHHSDVREDPYPFLNQIREHTPIFRDAMSQWWVTRHADVSTGLRNRSLSVDPRQLDHTRDIGGESARPSALSSWFRHQANSPLARLYNDFLLFLDPPRHTLLRKAFSPLFSHDAVQHLTHYIDERVATLVAEMRNQPAPDLMRGLALPLPVSVISMVYGVPEDDAPFVAQWARDLGIGLDAGMSHQATQKAEQSADDFTRYLREHVSRLRSTHTSSQHASLLNVDEVIRNGITPDELVAHIAMSYFAGFETTTNTIGNGTLALLRNPDQFTRLREDPSLAENAVDELLRYDCPVLYALRFALEDTEIAGQAIARGSSITFMLAAANRDPAVFPDPDRLDITRTSAKHHVAFSHGAHYCLGASLARLELQRVFLALAKENFALSPGGLAWRKTFGFRGLDQFRITGSPDPMRP